MAIQLKINFDREIAEARIMAKEAPLQTNAIIAQLNRELHGMARQSIRLAMINKGISQDEAIEQFVDEIGDKKLPKKFLRQWITDNMAFYIYGIFKVEAVPSQKAMFE